MATLRLQAQYRNLAIAVIVGLTFLIVRECKLNAEKSIPKITPSSLEQLTSITLSQKKDTLQLAKREGQWFANGLPADSSLVETLLECLAAIKVEQPMELSQEQRDSTQALFESKGVNVNLNAGERDAISYQLAPWHEHTMILSQAPKHDRFYACSLPGYRPEVLLNVSLEPAQWQEQRFGVERPNEIRVVNVAWCNPWEEFTVTVDSITGKAKVYGDTKSAPIPYDTLRLSTFLYSLTQLEAQPAGEAHAEEYARACQDNREQFRLSIITQRGDTLIYSIYPMPGGGSNNGMQGNSEAIVKSAHNAYATIQLSKWALTMIHLEALHPDTAR